MKHKKILIILFLIIILVGIILLYVFKNSDNMSLNDYESVNSDKSIDLSNNRTEKKEKKTNLKSNSEIKSALVEQIEPHASYYLEEILVEENQFVEKDANILKYTNGTYLTAPYDCLITALNLPELDEKILNGHYVELSSSNMLSVTMNVSEEYISKVNVGTIANISVPTLEKEYTGYVTRVASTASNGRFKVTIEFENDGNIKLGMTASVEINV